MGLGFLPEARRVLRPGARVRPPGEAESPRTLTERIFPGLCLLWLAARFLPAPAPDPALLATLETVRIRPAPMTGMQEVVLPEEWLGRGRTYALRVRGDSMIEEQIRDGDTVVVETREMVRNGETVIALIDGDSVAVNGVCASGGLHFLSHAEIVIASETARFLDTHPFLQGSPIPLGMLFYFRSCMAKSIAVSMSP